jgi:hypothetical protein
MTDKIKNVTKLVTFSPDMWEKIEALREEHGLLRDQDAIRHCVSFTWKKEHPNYVEALKERANKTPEDKAKEKEEVEKAKAQREADKLAEKIENGRRIARELRGTIHKDRNNNEKCTFFVYQFTNVKNASVGEKTVYLDDLTDEEVEKQYMNTITNEPEDPLRVIETLVSLGVTDKEGKPL